ncbi:MAG: hypothetical protein J6D38_07970, partial [Solobacterium sp.]|nr:hypothetical protein [Solobacterium sp.]
EMGSGGFSTLICEGMKEKDVAELKEKIMKVDGVKNVIWYDSVLDISVPMDVLPDNIRDAFNADNSTMMFIIFSDTTSADRTI